MMALCLSCTLAAQQPEIDTGANPTLGEVVTAVETQTDFRFVYASGAFSTGQRLNWPARTWTLESLLARLRADLPAAISVQGRTIVLKPVQPASGPGVQGSPGSTASGYVSDAGSGERLIGATVVDQLSGAGTFTNAYGYFALPLRADSCQLRISYLGYEPRVLPRRMAGRFPEEIALRPRETQMEEVVIESSRAPEDQPQMSAFRVDPAFVRQLPAIGGETDLLRSLQLLPGIQGGTEGAAGFFVRGGSPDQNLIVLDDVPLYNVSHLFGFVSVFNTDAIRHVDLFSGAFPARYGGRLSSVLDISMKEGNLNNISGSFSLSPVASRFTLEGPLVKNRVSFIVSARRTFADPFIRAVSRNQKLQQGRAGGFSSYFFYDLNLKLNAVLSPRDRLYLSVYAGRDRYTDQNIFDGRSNGGTFLSEKNARIGWGNRIASLRWNHVYQPRLFSNFTVYYTEYGFTTETEDTDRTRSGTQLEQFGLTVSSQVQDLGLKADYFWYPGKGHAVRWGMQAVAHRFLPGSSSFLQTGANGFGNRTESFVEEETRSGEGFGYIEDEIRIGLRTSLNMGLHASGYAVGSTRYGSLQPRAVLNYKTGTRSALKGSFSRMTQYLHLLTNSGIGLPTDLWIGATEEIGPQQAWQAAVGYVQSFDGGWNLSAEAYYKSLDGLYAYREGASFFLNTTSIASRLVEGEGQAYGAEIFLKKETGRLTGWVAYGLSRADRLFPDLNRGQRFPFTFDRRHDVNIVANYALSSQWRLSATWEFASGRAVTLPVAYFGALGLNTPIFEAYSDVNAYRYKPYHRLDLGVTSEKEIKWGIRTLGFSIYNAYNRLNTFYLSLEDQADGTKAFVDNTLFPLIPSISYGIRF